MDLRDIMETDSSNVGYQLIIDVSCGNYLNGSMFPTWHLDEW